jgi:hypothetical protein
VDVTSALAEQTIDLAERHGLHGYDALHLDAHQRSQRISGASGSQP